MPEIKNLTDKNGNIVYPRTSSDAVKISDGFQIFNSKNVVCHWAVNSFDEYIG